MIGGLDDLANNCAETVGALMSAVQRRDVEAFLGLLSPGVAWEIAHWEGERRTVGQADLADFLSDLERHEDRTTVEELVPIKRSVVVRHTVMVGNPPGASYGGTQFAVFECAGSRVSRRRTFAYRKQVLDALELTRADRQGLLVVRDDEDGRLYHFGIRTGSRMAWTRYSIPGGHVHCELCWTAFAAHGYNHPKVSHEGYATLDGSRWLCRDCFDEVRDHFDLGQG